MKLPKRIYVQIKQDSKEPYLIASKGPEGEDGETIGIYILKETKKIKNWTELK